MVIQGQDKKNQMFSIVNNMIKEHAFVIVYKQICLHTGALPTI